jgi:hypothetical protein
MKLRENTCSFRTVFLFVAAMAGPAMLTGCTEANLAIDFILGSRTPKFVASHPMSPFSGIWSRKRTPGEKGLFLEEAANRGSTMPPRIGRDAKPELPVDRNIKNEGEIGRRDKRESLDVLPQDREVAPTNTMAPQEAFSFPRDPFQPPTEEVLLAECPPSMPLCRFDRSQLKLRGLIQVGDEQFKGMVEDPDGRGYFITPGMQISGATVTQVTNRGITLFVHKSKKIDWMLIGGRDSREN